MTSSENQLDPKSGLNDPFRPPRKLQSVTPEIKENQPEVTESGQFKALDITNNPRAEVHIATREHREKMVHLLGIKEEEDLKKLLLSKPEKIGQCIASKSPTELRTLAKKIDVLCQKILDCYLVGDQKIHFKNTNGGRVYKRLKCIEGDIETILMERTLENYDLKRLNKSKTASRIDAHFLRNLVTRPKNELQQKLFKYFNHKKNSFLETLKEECRLQIENCDQLMRTRELRKTKLKKIQSRFEYIESLIDDLLDLQ